MRPFGGPNGNVGFATREVETSLGGDHLDLNIGIEVDEFGEPGRQESLGKFLCRGHADYAGKIAFALRDNPLENLGFVRDLLGLRQDRSTRFAQTVAVPTPVEQANRKCHFECRDPPGDRGLIGAEFASGGERAAFSRGGQKELEVVPVIHSLILQLCRTILQQGGLAISVVVKQAAALPLNEGGFMFDPGPAEFAKGLRTKNLVFAAIAAMMAYVLWHNERFLIEPLNPIWKHYQDLGVFILIHGVAGGSALILAPMQFSERLRTRFTKLHRVIGRIYVFGALILAPVGVFAQYLDYKLGVFPSASFVTETFIQAALLMTTTSIGFVFALKRMIPQHRQWMTRSYAAALTFFQIRVILGVTGWDQDPTMVEPVVWSCTASAILIGDIANQIYELQSLKRRPGRAPLIQAVAAE